MLKYNIIHSFLVATCFSHIWAIIKQHFVIGETTALYTLSSVLPGTSLFLLLVSFEECFHCIFLADISVFCVVYFVMYVFNASTFIVEGLCLLLNSCSFLDLVYSSTLKMKATSYCETSVDFRQSMRLKNSSEE
jgi:hypothetical protein